MKVLIFGKSFNEGMKFFNQLIGEMKFKDVKKITKSGAELYDGTVYQVLPANQYARGYRCDKVYIQRGIDDDIVNEIILPTLAPFTETAVINQVEWFD